MFGKDKDYVTRTDTENLYKSIRKNYFDKHYTVENRDTFKHLKCVILPYDAIAITIRIKPLAQFPHAEINPKANNRTKQIHLSQEFDYNGYTTKGIIYKKTFYVSKIHDYE